MVALCRRHRGTLRGHSQLRPSEPRLPVLGLIILRRPMDLVLLGGKMARLAPFLNRPMHGARLLPLELSFIKYLPTPGGAPRRFF